MTLLFDERLRVGIVDEVPQDGLQREQSLLAPHNDHNPELEPLRAVHRAERNAVVGWEIVRLQVVRADTAPLHNRAGAVLEHSFCASEDRDVSRAILRLEQWLEPLFRLVLLRDDVGK